MVKVYRRPEMIIRTIKDLDSLLELSMDKGDTGTAPGYSGNLGAKSYGMEDMQTTPLKNPNVWDD